MKTKKLCCVLMSLFCLQQAFAQDTKTATQFTLQGKLSGAKTDSVLLYYTDASGAYAHLSKPIVNNTFTLNGNISQPVSARILFKHTGEVIPREKYEDRMREIYLEPSVLKLSGNPAEIKKLKISCSKTELEYEELTAKTTSIREEMKPLEEAFMKEKDHEKAAAIHDQFEPYFNRIKKVTYQFFLDHPNSYVTLDMMRYYVSQMKLDSTKAVYNAFNDKLKATDAAKELDAKIKTIESGMPRSTAAVFTKADINGKQLSLTDFKGKYVMLDFWASWCVPCRKGNPHMIEVYNKYKDKGLDIIGMADDDGKIPTWNAAVAKDNVGIWYHVLRGLKMDMIMKHIPNPEDLDERYGISSIPTKILIDPSGKIIGRFGDSFGGTDEDMDKMLASVFDK